MPYPNWEGKTRHWTQEKVIFGLRVASIAIVGHLPCNDCVYASMRVGHMDWPTSHRVLEYFGSMGRGWLIAGVDKSRVSLNQVDWIPEEENYLKEHAGEKTITKIADELRRSPGAIKRRLHDIGIKARDNQGYLSAAQLAQYFNCPVHRVRDSLRAGEIPGRFDKLRTRWEIDLVKLSEENKAMLMAPKKTYTSIPPDVGDYYKRRILGQTTFHHRAERVLLTT